MVIMDTRRKTVIEKGNMYNFIHDPEAATTWGSRDLPDTDDIDVPARCQAAKSSNIPP
jgi:hypothetical protein